MGPKAIIEALAMGAQNMVMTAILLCSVGLIVNVIATAGVGNTFSLMINEWAGHSLVIAIVLIALASLVLGMGLPVTAAYIVLGTLSAPALHALISDGLLVNALVNGQIPEAAKAIFMLAAPDKLAEIGNPMTTAAARAIVDAVPVDMASMVREAVLTPHALTYALLSAHLIVFWLSQDSNVTPPVALAAFTGAAIAGTKPMATGLQSWKLAKGLYIIPLLFAYTPFIGGSWIDDFTIFFFALFGLYAFAAGTGGFHGSTRPPADPPAVIRLRRCAALAGDIVGSSSRSDCDNRFVYEQLPQIPQRDCSRLVPLITTDSDRLSSPSHLEPFYNWPASQAAFNALALIMSRPSSRVPFLLDDST